MFGGWLMGQMDLAGAIPAFLIANGEIATRAVNHMQFFKPIMIGELVEFFAEVVNVGKTSITVAVKVYTRSRHKPVAEPTFVAEGELVYVALQAIGKPRALR